MRYTGLRGMLSLAALSFALALGSSAAQAAVIPAYGHSAIQLRDGYPVFTVDGKPFFVYGAAFFYERLPRDLWRVSMGRLKDLGVNTLDLYVPWNWHELADGDFDFDGRTSPRRDLHEVLALARELGFKILLRPGPVIRNEWRNAGYPAWLLARPEYGMPLHDLLEGRYPPTATLQNANSDDAAAAWMQNATHLRYARRWLERVLHECEPVADRVLAVQLDDDQGAYIDNQTWPAPHFAAYLRWLASVVHGVTGPAEPVFINTYDMKVTGSSPVWAMGNWYQSDTYSIGEHDRTQLELATGLLQTQREKPVMVSEFQAGWLEQPDDIRPRAADPSNTELAIATMLAMGARGIVNFPAQDTLYPSGMEAPFANAFYAWDAALPLAPQEPALGCAAPSLACARTIASVHPGDNQRASPTAYMGSLIALYGTHLASSHVVADAGIVYTTSAFDETQISNADIATIAAQSSDAQRTCRTRSLTCTLVDLRYTSDAALQRFSILIVPMPPVPSAATMQLTPAALDRLARYARGGGIVVSLSRSPGRAFPHALVTTDSSLSGALVDLALRAARHQRAVSYAPGATLALSSDGSGLGFLTIPNYGTTNVTYDAIVLHPDERRRIVLRDIEIPARRVFLTPLSLKLDALGAKHGSGRLAYTSCLHLGVANDSRDLQIWTRADSAQLPCHTVLQIGNHERCFVSTASGSQLTVATDGTVRQTTPAGLGGGSRICGKKSHAVEASYALSFETIRVPGTTTTQRPWPIRRDQALPGFVFPPVAREDAIASLADVYRDGSAAVVLRNAEVQLVVAPAAGARAFIFEDLTHGTSIFSTVGALRDDVKTEPPLSTVDKIAKYTHQFPAGMFNRPYSATLVPDGRNATVRFAYDAPDVVPHGAHFERTVTLAPGARAFTVDEAPRFTGGNDMPDQRAVSVTSLAVGAATTMETATVLSPNPAPFAANTAVTATSNVLGFYDSASHELATIAWRPGDIEQAQILQREYSIVVRLTITPGRTARSMYGYYFAGDLAAAQQTLAAVGAAAAQGQALPDANTVARQPSPLGTGSP